MLFFFFLILFLPALHGEAREQSQQQVYRAVVLLPALAEVVGGKREEDQGSIERIGVGIGFGLGGGCAETAGQSFLRYPTILLLAEQGGIQRGEGEAIYLVHVSCHVRVDGVVGVCDQLGRQGKVARRRFWVGGGGAEGETEGHLVDNVGNLRSQGNEVDFDGVELLVVLRYGLRLVFEVLQLVWRWRA